MSNHRPASSFRSTDKITPPYISDSSVYFLPVLGQRNDYKDFLQQIKSPIIHDWDFREFLEDIEGMSAPIEEYKWNETDYAICNHLKVIFDDFVTPEEIFQDHKKEWQKNQRAVYKGINHLSHHLGICVAKTNTIAKKTEKLQKKPMSHRTAERRLQYLTEARLLFRMAFRKGIDRGAPRIMVTRTHAPKAIVSLYRCGYKQLAAVLISFFLEASFDAAMKLLWDLFDDHPEPDFPGEAGGTVRVRSPKLPRTEIFTYYPPKGPPKDGREQGRKIITDEDRWRVGRYMADRGASEEQIISAMRLLDELYPRILSQIRFLEAYIWKSVRNGASWKSGAACGGDPRFADSREDVRQLALSAAKGSKKSPNIGIEIHDNRMVLKTHGLDPTVNVLFFNRTSYKRAYDAITHLIRKDPLHYNKWCDFVLPKQELRYSIATSCVAESQKKRKDIL